MKTTDELQKILQNSSNIKEYMQNNAEDIGNISFVTYLNECAKKTGKNRSQIIDGANIQKNYGYQIFDGTKNPSRDKVLALCFSMNLSPQQTNRLLTLSGHAVLYPRMKRDSILQFALSKGKNLMDTNLLLDEMGQSPIE